MATDGQRTSPNRRSAAREILLFGLLGGTLVAILGWLDVRFFVAGGPFALYGGVIALLFAGLGLWLGASHLRKESGGTSGRATHTELPTAEVFVRDEERLAELGLTPRELEILETIAAGLSNREIANELFVSENTVKTHASRLFDKLGARRRTQAVDIARRNGLLP